MTLIVEDGSAMVDAESFASVAEADAYFAARGGTNNDTWEALDTDVKEQCLRRATDYMEQEYRFAYDGYRYTKTQALSWPRWEVRITDYLYGYRGWPDYIGFDTVPQNVKRACIELALRANAGPLYRDVSGGSSSLVKKRVKVGPIETEYDTTRVTTQDVYPAVDGWLEPFLKGNRYSAPVTRS